MSNKPFIAARVESWFDRRLERLLRFLGWRERVITYTGYANENTARVLGRVVLSPSWSDTPLGQAAETFLKRRGWRNFFTAACVHASYTVQFGEAQITGRTDRGGYIDDRLHTHALAPGWHHADITVAGSAPAQAPVQVIADNVTFGIVSDLDDTVISTILPRLLIAAWNTFWRTEAARSAVPGMAELYRTLLKEHPGAPIIYLSTGAWNTQGFLCRFLARHRFPQGALLLTDWGPTNTGFFRSGQQHKKDSLRQLALRFPNIRWVLVGDDGQHDPYIYGSFARHQPDRVAMVLIRQLNPTEQMLAHGSPEFLGYDVTGHKALTLIGPDGRSLLRQLRDMGRV